jgi:hypothetical protein
MLKNERVRARKLTQLAADKLKPGPTRREVPNGVIEKVPNHTVRGIAGVYRDTQVHFKCGQISSRHLLRGSRWTSF